MRRAFLRFIPLLTAAGCVAATVLPTGAGAAAAKPKIDLSVSAIVVTGSNAPGSQVIATVTVRNAGSARAGASKTVVAISRDRVLDD